MLFFRQGSPTHSNTHILSPFYRKHSIHDQRISYSRSMWFSNVMEYHRLIWFIRYFIFILLFSIKKRENWIKIGLSGPEGWNEEKKGKVAPIDFIGQPFLIKTFCMECLFLFCYRIQYFFLFFFSKSCINIWCLLPRHPFKSLSNISIYIGITFENVALNAKCKRK